MVLKRHAACDAPQRCISFLFNIEVVSFGGLMVLQPFQFAFAIRQEFEFDGVFSEHRTSALQETTKP